MSRGPSTFGGGPGDHQATFWLAALTFSVNEASIAARILGRSRCGSVSMTGRETHADRESAADLAFYLGAGDENRSWPLARVRLAESSQLAALP
jgi:hypothetical protein